MNDNSSIPVPNDSVITLLLQGLYDDKVQATSDTGEEKQFFTKRYYSQTIYFNEYGLYYLSVPSMAYLFNLPRQNVYRSIYRIENNLQQAKAANGQGTKNLSHPIDDSGFRTVSSLVEIERARQLFEGYEPLKLTIYDGRQQRKLRLYPPIIIQLVVGRLTKLHPNALSFLSMTTAILKHHVAFMMQAWGEGYAVAHQENAQDHSVSAPSQVDQLHTNQTIIELQRALIDTQRELTQLYNQIHNERRHVAT